MYYCGEDQIQYQVFLAIAQASDGLLAQGLGGGVGVLALGQLDGARCQEGAHSVVPRTSVDVGEVVLIGVRRARAAAGEEIRSEEHTSELQSRGHLVCRLLLEKKKTL